jgi:hypothetical protein
MSCIFYVFLAKNWQGKIWEKSVNLKLGYSWLKWINSLYFKNKNLLDVSLKQFCFELLTIAKGFDL